MSQSRSWTGAALRELAMGHFMIAHVLQVAAELELFTHLAAGPVPINDLATRLGVYRPAIGREATTRLPDAGAVGDLLVAGHPGNFVPLLAGASGVYQDWV